MNDILMTNIFFLITAVSSVITTILLIIVLIYVLKFLKHLRNISEIVKKESVKIVGDVENIRSVVKKNIGVIKSVVNATFIKSLLKKIFNKK
jgi:hypothetical protein